VITFSNVTLFNTPTSQASLETNPDAQALLSEIEEYATIIEDLQERRAQILSKANTLLSDRQLCFMGEENGFYLGPSVDHQKFILLFFKRANHPLNQMRRYGKRMSVTRDPKPKPTPKPKSEFDPAPLPKGTHEYLNSYGI
jgi:hypothetical protein